LGFLPPGIGQQLRSFETTLDCDVRPRRTHGRPRYRAGDLRGLTRKRIVVVVVMSVFEKAQFAGKMSGGTVSGS
jgi:hypothetical protein